MTNYKTPFKEQLLRESLESLKYHQEGLTLYKAGLPQFDRNFARDGIISSAFLLKDTDMLRDQLIYCALHQGERKDRHTGEEPGKIFHETPAAEIRGKSVKYNACDTTGLFLIGFDVYQRLADSDDLTKKYKKNIEAAVEYIQAHLKNDFFTEDPHFCGAEKFGLKVTYWKDSVIHGRETGEPKFPVVYFLAHVQNMAGIRSAARLLKSQVLEKQAEKMSIAMKDLYDEKTGLFHVAVDCHGPIEGAASDSLHALCYLEPKDLSPEQARQIARGCRVLETQIGYRTLDPQIESSRPYHAKTVWPYEQAMTHIGAKKFGITQVADICSRIKKFLNSNHEMITFCDTGAVQKEGCNPCLWTIAARHYFSVTA